MTRSTRYAAVVLWACLMAGSAFAHESQPATLELRQLTPERYEVTWRAPIYFGRPHPSRLALPEGWRDVVQPTTRVLPDSQVLRRVVSIAGAGIDGSTIHFPGLEKTITDVFVRLTRIDGTAMTGVAGPAKPFVQLRGERRWYAAAADYIAIGFHHILRGIDHLLFIFGLLLIVQKRVMLVKTISAFTLAHSITLAIATLGYASVPLPPLNAAIALSIVFLGPEIIRVQRGQSSLTIRRPWMVAFAFGLLHGFGFATGLSITGMPRAELPVALLFFNVGVELGQLLFVVIVGAVATSLGRLQVTIPRWVKPLPGYVIGSAAAFWFTQRAAVMLL